jgi:pimeloyl-ACP methyl ester carboxylesterase
MIVASPAREQTRARYPDEEGFVEVEGVRIFWERYGQGAQTILFTPTWELVHSRCWKMQIPYFARHGCVVTFDPPGNGRSDRPLDGAAYERSAVAEYAAAVLDAARVERAVVVSWCDMGEALVLAAEHPQRVSGVVFIAPALPVGEREVAQFPFDKELDTDEGWAKENRHYWLREWRGYVEFFISKMFTEPHSTKQIEDCVGWGLETDAETLLVSFRGWDTKDSTRRRRSSSVRGSAARCSSSTEPKTSSSSLSALARSRRSWALPSCSSRGRVTGHTPVSP